jgi:hypothetical protein
VLLFVNRKPGKPRFDPRITLRQKDAIPYGTKVAKDLLPLLFPHASIYADKKAPGRWDSINTVAAAQAVILPSKFFNADESELASLLEFARAGNTVFIITQSFSSEAANFFRFQSSEYFLSEQIVISEDSVQNFLQPAVFGTSNKYVYPGKKFESYFVSLDTATTQVLGTNEKGKANFIGFRAGKGQVFVHTSPVSFSNYFILHKNNGDYYQQVLSVLPSNTRKIVWNEYYLIKMTGDKKDRPNWLSILMKFPAFKWALLTAMAALLLYLILGMRRRQREIPVFAKPRNESLDFVKTLGRLYFDRGDHRNLALKMSSHFFEHIGSQYRLHAAERDEAFLRRLQEKSGYDPVALKEIFDFIAFVESAPAISERQLAVFHQQLEHFYQNT